MGFDFGPALTDIFAALGQDAVYTDKAGNQTPIIVIPAQPDVVTDFSGTKIFSRTTTFEVLVSALPNPGTGATVTYNGVVYRIQGVPQYAGADRLVWQLDTAPA